MIFSFLSFYESKQYGILFNIKAALFCMLCISLSSDGTELKGGITDFSDLYDRNVTQEQLKDGIKVNRCAVNKSEHGLAASKLCIPKTFYHCLPFQGNYLVICKESKGLFLKGTYPVIDNGTKNINALPCPNGTYQLNYYHSYDYNISCIDNRTSETELTTKSIVSDLTSTSDNFSNQPTANKPDPSTTSKPGSSTNYKPGSSTTNKPGSNSFGLNGDKIAGICIGVVGFIVLFIILPVIFYLRRRKRQRNNEKEDEEKPIPAKNKESSENPIHNAIEKRARSATNYTDKYPVQETHKGDVEETISSENNKYTDVSLHNSNKEEAKSSNLSFNDKYPVQETNQGDQQHEIVPMTNKQQNTSECLDLEFNSSKTLPYGKESFV